ncbi:MAG TPA: class I SAM-dependent methyltransferase [Acidimicrobiales bacterium]|nr:class I SAM-dependent methyltransferase [Acidimicrobiales bacterium]
MARVDYSGRMATVYDAGRRLSTDAVATWMAAAARHVGSPQGPILDLGSGTGRFSAALAARFGVPVVAAEPAEGMREQAAGRRGPQVSLVAARAEALPFRGASFAVVWASQIIHHVEDLLGCAEDLRRVLRPGGTLLLRGVFAATAEGIPWARYFPAAVRTVTSVYPTLERITDVFAASGLRRQDHEVVVQIVAASLGELYERVRLRADSTLEMLPDDEFALGLARMAAEARTETSPTPVAEPVELVVFR